MIAKTWSPEAANNFLLTLPPDEQATIVEYGVMLRLADLRRRLSHAQSTIRELAGKYHTTLAELQREGLPEDAGYEMHEDYILWHHYAENIPKMESGIAALENALKTHSRVTEDASRA